MYIISQIIRKYERSADWRGNPGEERELSGNRSIRIQQKDYDACGRSELLKEARLLEERGLIAVRWFADRTDMERITYRLADIPRFYELLGENSKAEQLEEECRRVRAWAGEAGSPWLKRYYEDQLAYAGRGRHLPDLGKYGERLFQCLNALERLTEPVYYRAFSSRLLGGSKVFENELRERVIAIAREYHPAVSDAMDDYQVLSQLFLESYTQEMALKGDLRIWLDGKLADLSVFPYGVVLNTETLRRARIDENQTVRKVVTVENKANYMAMPYEKETLIIFSHGFFSPLEKEFLRKLEEALSGAGTEYYHTGDLDYGGVRIFQYIRTEIFPKLKPLRMDVKQYEMYFGYASDIEPSAWEKLSRLQEPALQPLIDRILKEKKVIEQEVWLDGIKTIDTHSKIL